MSELEQWCEIDGHTWIHGYSSYGLMLGSQTVIHYRKCEWCQKEESTIWKEVNSDFKYHTIIWNPDY